MKTRIQLIKLLLQSNTIDEVLAKFGSDQEKGWVFEAITDLFIKFGCFEQYSNDKFYHLIGNFDLATLTKLSSYEQYLQENYNQSSRSGKVDIVLQNKTTKQFILFSSKYIKIKNVKKYDISDINNTCKEIPHYYVDYIIGLVVPNKTDVLKLADRAHQTSALITKHIKLDNIIDLSDLEKVLGKFKDRLNSVEQKDWTKTFLSAKPPLKLRFHQQLFVDKTIKQIKLNQNRFLYGCKPRSGKTYMVGGMVKAYFEQKLGQGNILVITPLPTETLSQFSQDMFHKYEDFSDYNIIELNKENIHTIDHSQKNIIIASKQFLQREKNVIYSDFGMFVFDENHFGGTTNISENIINTYCTPKTIVIYLTATFNKVVHKYQITDECRMFWNLEDENICKSVVTDNSQIEKLKEKFGVEDVDHTIQTFLQQGYTLTDIFNPYLIMPTFYFLSSYIQHENYDRLARNLKQNDTGMGLSMNTLFSLNETKEQFNYQNELKTFLCYVSGSNKEQDERKNFTCLYTRINNICRHNCDIPFTQLWFLPADDIDQRSKCLLKLIKQNKILKQYDVMIVNSQEQFYNLKKQIELAEFKAREDGKSGLILLAGGMLNIGITLSYCDLVLLLHDSPTADKVIQQIYRCMTERDHKKKFGFVIDLNINRVLSTAFTLDNSNRSKKDKLIYLMKYNLINIDSDLFCNEQLDIEQIAVKLYKLWNTTSINRIENVVKLLDSIKIVLDNPQQKILNDFYCNSSKSTRTLASVSASAKEQNLPSGQTKQENDEKIEDDEDEQVEEYFSFTKDMLPVVIVFACLFNFNQDQTTLIELLRNIKDDDELKKIFNQHCCHIWSKNKKHEQELLDKLDVVEYIINVLCEQEIDDLDDITMSIKLELEKLSNRPKQLLEYIGKIMKPNTKEKKDHGEVFTPIHIIEDMLNKLPDHVWTNPKLKWFDPANGVGNFAICVYFRLMKRLTAIPLKDRKKHILEKMIYVSELQAKNNLIYQQIVNLNGQYKLNIHQGDTLELNPMIKWGVKKFDIIMGNPPYNKGGIWSYTKQMNSDERQVLWMEFIKKALEWLQTDGYLLYINPLYWLKKNNELHNIMLEKYIIWMKLWDDSQSKGIIDADIPISLYILCNKNNIEKCKTVIESNMKRQKISNIYHEYLDQNYTIPFAYHNIFNKLLNFIKIHNLVLEYKTKTVKSIGDQFLLQSEHNIEDMFAIDTYIIKETKNKPSGIYVKKAIQKHPDADKRKLVIANKCGFHGAFIDDGKLSLTGTNKYYILGDNLELLLKLLKFNIVDIICNNLRYTQHFLDKESFTYIPDIRKLGIEDIDELEFYKMIGLTTEEINLFYEPEYATLIMEDE